MNKSMIMPETEKIYFIFLRIYSNRVFNLYATNKNSLKRWYTKRNFPKNHYGI
jgi:hypothetical protein